MRAAQLKKPGTGSKTSQDLTEPTKWVLSDLTAFVHIMKEVERELGKWQSEKEKCISYLRELESDMLKGALWVPVLIDPVLILVQAARGRRRSSGLAKRRRIPTLLGCSRRGR